MSRSQRQTPIGAASAPKSSPAAAAKMRQRVARPDAAPGVDAPKPGWAGRDWLIALLLLAALLIAYYPALHGTPIWDDSGHLTKPELRSWAGLGRIWFEMGATQQYYPLTHSVFWIEHRLWGDWYPGYHLVNILLQVVSAMLLVRIMRRLGVPGAWLAAGIWALHPVQVESVAWMSELKNTLSGVFYFSATLVYLRFDRERQAKTWWIALGLFFAGLLSKSVIDTLPAALLLVFYWKRGVVRWRRDVLPLIPFFAIGIGSGLVTSWVERTYVGASGNEFNYSLIERALIAGRAFWFYLAKLAWPAKLTFIYPQWEIHAGVWWQYVFPIAAVALVAVLWIERERWGRGPLVAMLYFGGTLLPALGFVNIFPFRYSFVADHFQYLACVGPIALAAALISMGLSGIEGRAGGVAARRICCSGILLALCVATWRQCAMYSDIETLWRTTIARNPDCWMAYNNLSVISLDAGRADEARAEVGRALELHPVYCDAYVNLGNVLQHDGRMDEAVAAYKRAIEIEPRVPLAQCNLGAILFEMGRFDEAFGHIQTALELDPDSGDAEYYLASIYLAKGQLEEAAVHYRKSLELEPDLANGHIYLAEALMRLGQVDEAIAQFQAGLELKADDARAHYDLGMALMTRGRIREAISEWKAAMAAAPSNSNAPNELAWVLATSPDATIRDGTNAVEFALQAVKLSRGEDPGVVDTLAAAYAEAGRYSDAVETAERALSLAKSQGNTSLAGQVLAHLSLYEAGHPFRDAPFQNAGR
jgi:tetratricopeptide (TPR) repeat protein